MHASGINSSVNQNIASFQAQQQQRAAQQFQSQIQTIGEQFQSGSLSTAQASALSEESLPAATSTTPASDSQSDTSSCGGSHFNHRPHINVDSSNTSSQALDPLSPALQSMPSSALQAYSAVGQNLQAGFDSDSVSITA
jgi:hypothetical protein